MELSLNDPIAASTWSSSLLIRRCDDHLNPPYAQATFAGAHAGLVRDLATSLLLVGRIDRFNARVATGGDLVADIRPIEPGMLIGEIERVTEMISERQVRTNRTSRWCFSAIWEYWP